MLRQGFSKDDSQCGKIKDLISLKNISSNQLYEVVSFIRDVFKLVRDFSVAPYKPSDSAQKFDGPLNLASQVREAESLNKKQKQ